MKIKFFCDLFIFFSEYELSFLFTLLKRLLYAKKRANVCLAIFFSFFTKLFFFSFHLLQE